jgi:transcriptional regulator with XRE-family HTH domain
LATAARKTRYSPAASVGGRLMALRKSSGLTLEELSERSGFTKGYLSKIENGRQTPPIGSLSRIAQALGTDIAAFFRDEEPAARSRVSVVRANDRPPVQRGETAFGYDYQSLAHELAHKRMQPFVFTFPSEIDKYVFFEHEGEEFLFVLKGRVAFQVGVEKWVLEAGDSIYFESRIPHRGWSVGGEAQALVVIYSADRPPQR